MTAKTLCLKIFINFGRFIGTFPFDVVFKEDGSITKRPSKGFNYYMTIVIPASLAFIFHVKVRVYDALVQDTSLKTWVFVGTSSVTLLCVIGQIIISALCKKTIIKVMVGRSKWSRRKSMAVYKMQMSCIVFVNFIAYCIIFMERIPFRLSKLPNFLMTCLINSFTESVTFGWCFTYFTIIRDMRTEVIKLYDESVKDDLSAEALRKIWSKYLSLFSAIKKINFVFGINALLCHTFVYVWQLYNGYAFLHGIVQPNPPKFELAVMVAWIFIQSFKSIVLVIEPPKCKEYIRRLRMRLAFYPTECSHIEEVILIRNKMINMDINFTAFYWFDIDYGLVLSSTTSLIMNLMILLQFSQPNQL